MKTSVCVCTYKRPELLDGLLNKLTCLKTNENDQFDVVVVDNDQKQTALPIVNNYKHNNVFSIKYFNEKRKGISFARNKCVENADGELIAFIDDDEFPESAWLINLIKTMQEFSASAVFGPVRPYFNELPPEWLLKSGLCDRAEHATGFVVPQNERRTGNVLIKKEILTNFKPVFRNEFANGSEDTDLFNRLSKEGHLFVWCNEAITYEIVPPNRWKRSYYLRRALLRGSSSLKRTDNKIISIVKSIIAIPLYVLFLPILVLFKKQFFMKYAVKICDHIGKMFALVGIRLIREKE